MSSADEKRPSAEEIMVYEKDPKTKIATITVNRPDRLNAPTIAARLRYADLVHRANVDDDVKVLILRGAGDHFGSGADLPEMADMWSDNPKTSPLKEFRIGDDEGVKYPPMGSHRHLSNLTQLYARPDAGIRSLQDFKKISIVEAKGYCYGWHFYQAADADLVISSDDALYGHSAWRYVGWAARQWQWVVMMGLRKFQEMVFTGRPFTAQEMYDCNFVNSVVPRDQLEAETMKYALACSNTRPTDTVVMQKTFFEIYKQQQGEYMGTILAGWLESMLPLVKNDPNDLVVGDKLFREQGLAAAVKDNDAKFPADWRMSFKGRHGSNEPRPQGGTGSREVAQLRAQIDALQEQVRALERKIGK